MQLLILMCKFQENIYCANFSALLNPTKSSQNTRVNMKYKWSTPISYLCYSTIMEHFSMFGMIFLKKYILKGSVVSGNDKSIKHSTKDCTSWIDVCTNIPFLHMAARYLDIVTEFGSSKTSSSKRSKSSPV